MDNNSKFLLLIFILFFHDAVKCQQGVIDILRGKYGQQIADSIQSANTDNQIEIPIKVDLQLNQFPNIGEILYENYLKPILGSNQRSNIINSLNDREIHRKNALTNYLKTIVPLLNTIPIDKIPIADEIFDKTSLSQLLNKNTINSLTNNPIVDIEKAINILRSEIMSEINEVLKPIEVSGLGNVKNSKLLDIIFNNPILKQYPPINELIERLDPNHVLENSRLNLKLNEIFQNLQPEPASSDQNEESYLNPIIDTLYVSPRVNSYPESQNRKRAVNSQNEKWVKKQDTNHEQNSVNLQNSGLDLEQLIRLLKLKKTFQSHNLKDSQSIGNNPNDVNLKTSQNPEGSGQPTQAAGIPIMNLVSTLKLVPNLVLGLLGQSPLTN